MTSKPPYRKIYSLICHARSVVVNKRPAEHGDKRIVAQTPLHDSFGDMHAFYVPFLATFHDVELIEAAALICTVMQRAVNVVCVLQRVRLESLRARFPTDAEAALSKCRVEIIESKYLVKVSVSRLFLPLAQQAFHFPALIPRLMPFFAVHLTYYPVQPVYRRGVPIARSTDH